MKNLINAVVIGFFICFWCFACSCAIIGGGTIIHWATNIQMTYSIVFSLLGYIIAFLLFMVYEMKNALEAKEDK